MLVETPIVAGHCALERRIGSAICEISWSNTLRLPLLNILSLSLSWFSSHDEMNETLVKVLTRGNASFVRAEKDPS